MTACPVSHSTCDRADRAREPMRFRAVITIEFEADDEARAREAKAAIQSSFTQIRIAHDTAQIGFARRKPRVRPRPAAPGPVIAPYVD